MDIAALESVLRGSLKRNRIFGVALAVACPNRSFRWVGHCGELDETRPFFLASATKLFVTTILLQLVEEGRLRLDDPISRHLSADLVRGLHVYRGKDWSNELTIGHLMAHTSGLPDYFQAKRDDGKSLMERLLGGEDVRWTFEEAILATKGLRPLFPPGARGKAHYSDSNFQLLGKILENNLSQDLASAIGRRIAERLELADTYLYVDPKDTRPAPLRFRAGFLPIPEAMTSFGADGGAVSTARDTLTFLEAFFRGKLFDTSVLESLQRWNRIFFPLESGVGLHRFRLPRVFTPFRRAPVFLGHSGLSGAFAFYCPEKDLFLAGTVNQVAYPSESFRLLLRVAALFP
jgi:CubicO group peptidase (beta-lactamase class C family)